MALVSEKGKIVYLAIPKNACTSIKLFFYELIKGKPFNKDFRAIHDRSALATFDFKKFAADQSYFKFMVVRDPLDRFISAFNNRVLDYRELSEAWVKKHAPHEARGFKSLDLPFDPDVNLFASRMQDYIAVSGKIRHHFIPQSRFIRARLQAFDRIYNMYELKDLSADLEKRLQQPANFPRVQESEALSNAVKVGDLGKRELSKVIQYYMSDYVSLGRYL